jgi:uncharacterized protein
MAFRSSLRKQTYVPEWPRNVYHPATLPGTVLETAAGPCWLYEERYPLDQPHGGVALGACLELPQLAFVCLAKDRGLPPVDLRQAVFLDTETTGLAGGTGTTAFLVGIGHFTSDVVPRTADVVWRTAPCDTQARTTDAASYRVPRPTPATDARASDVPRPTSDAFVVRQFFMRDFAEERAMLMAVAEALAPFRHVVTFNGKSFDLPLLETRYILARLRRPGPPEAHLDLLHPARRLWRERLGSCSLAALEEAILGHRRQNDIPSWAIPGVYGAFLRHGEVGPLGRVFSHNRHDLLSLAALTTCLGRRLAEPLRGRLGPDELIGVARLYEGIGLCLEACACLELALERAGPALRERIQVMLALYYKRNGQRERAFALWRQVAAGPAASSAMNSAYAPQGSGQILTGLIEVAKHHEHHERDPDAALEAVEQALIVLELREAREGSLRWQIERANLERRYARLLRKRAHRLDWRR